MAIKSPRWCASCKAPHDGDCPKRVAWVKPAHVKSGRGGRPWARKRAAIFIRDHYLCQLCLHKGLLTAVDLHGSNAGVCDHKVPLAQGGTDDDENLQTICQSCDKEKTFHESRMGRGGSISKN